MKKKHPPNPNKNATYYYSYPKPDKFTIGPEIKKNLFKGHIITIGQSQKRAVLGKGDKATYSLKVKKGVKMGTLYAPDELKVTATNKKSRWNAKNNRMKNTAIVLAFLCYFLTKGKSTIVKKQKTRLSIR